MIFVDTGAWFALLIVDDPDHRAAQRWYDRNSTSLITTDYVIDELLTLVRTRVDSRRSIEIGRIILSEAIGDILRVEPEDFQAAWQVFSRFGDKQWSFTDCVSRVVMERLQITTAFVFDEHFRQFGTVSIVP